MSEKKGFFSKLFGKGDSDCCGNNIIEENENAGCCCGGNCDTVPTTDDIKKNEGKISIKILGTGCPKCKALEENAKKAVESAGVIATIDKITNLNEIMEYGVMVTPALVIDEVVKSAGKVLTVEEIKKYLI